MNVLLKAWLLTDNNEKIKKILGMKIKKKLLCFCFFSHVWCIHMGTYVFNVYITMQQLLMLYIFYDNKPNNANIFNVNILNAVNRLTACLCGEKYP